MEQKGFTVAVNVPVVNAIQGAVGAIKSIEKVGDSKSSRVNAMAAANSAWGTYQAGQGLAQMAQDPQGAVSQDVSVSITYGEQKNVDQTKTQGSKASSSQVNAGKQVNIVATGADENSNINIIGSDVAGKGGTNLFADNQINIKSAEQIHTERSENKSAGWNAGVAISYGQGGLAFGVTAGGNYGKGYGNGDEVTHRNSHVGDEHSQTNLKSGGATNIIGGQVLGNGITVDAAELNIASVQDTAKFKGEQQDMSAQVTVGYGFSASGSYSQSKTDADYAAVREQSGIIAGDDGYNITVKGNTDLKGAIITSTEAAEHNAKNKLTTGSITLSDIENHANYEASGFGIGGGFDYQGSGGQSSSSGIKGYNPSSTGINQSMGYGSDSGADSSITQAGINTKNIVITDSEAQKSLTDKTAEDAIKDAYLAVNSDNLDKSTGFIGNNFDKNKVQREIDLQVSVTKEFSQNVRQAGQELNTWQDSLEKENKEIKKELADGDITDERQADLINKLNKNNANIENIDDYKLALNTIGMALSAPTDSIAGIAAAAASPKLAYEIGQYFKSQEEINKLTGVNNGELTTGQKLAHVAAHAVLGAAVAAIGGNDALTAGLAAGGAEAAVPVISNWLYQTDDPEKLTAEQKSTLTAIAGLIGTGVGLSTGSSVTDVASGSQLAQNAVDNNAAMHFKKGEQQKYNQEIKSCRNDLNCILQVDNKWEKRKIENANELFAACDKGVKTTACNSLRLEIDTSGVNGYKNYWYPTGLYVDGAIEAAGYLGVGGNAKGSLSLGNRGAKAQFEGGVGLGFGAKIKAGENGSKKVEREESSAGPVFTKKLIELNAGSKPNDGNATLSTKTGLSGVFGPITAEVEANGGREYKDEKSAIYKNVGTKVEVKPQWGLGGAIKWDILNLRTKAYERKLQ